MNYSVRPATSLDLERIVEIINAQIPHPTTVEALVAMDQRHEDGQPLHRAVAVDSQGTIVGHLVAYAHSAMPPGTFYAQILVEPSYRRMGAGTAIDQYLADWVRAQGGTTVEASVKETDQGAQAWAAARGFAVQAHVYQSRLNLADWDPSPFQEAVARAEATGFRFTTVAAEGGLEVLPKLYDVACLTHSDIPGWEGRPVPPIDVWLNWARKDPAWSTGGVLAAVKGDQWAAICKVDVKGEGAWAYNDFTAVSREFRGLGLSLAVKVRALQWAKEQGIPYIKTDNHSLNQPMIATNKRLGYIPEPGKYELIRRLPGSQGASM